MVRNQRPSVSLQEHLEGCRQFFDHYAGSVQDRHGRDRVYHEAVESLARFYIPPDRKVLEVGCGAGDTLAAVRPSAGVGIDVSPEMIRAAKAKHPGLEFFEMPAENLDLNGRKFDYIILSGLIGFLYDIRLVFERLHLVCHPQTRVIINWRSRLRQPKFSAAEALGPKYRQPILNRTTPADVQALLYLADFEVVRARSHTLLSVRIPLLSSFANRFLANLPVIRRLNLSRFVVARPVRRACGPEPSVSVICPCRNEEGTIDQIARRLPRLGSHTELIFVEGNSKDNTLEACHNARRAYPDRDIRVFQQMGRGKGDAVRMGFAKASGDILMILDGDMGVQPEDLVPFYQAISSGKGEFINGSRLVYAVDRKAMPFLNLLGNKFFAWLSGALMGQPLQDVFCGTKVLWKSSYEEIARGRAYFGNFDQWGDLDLLFGAAKLNLRIVELHVRYRERTYGASNLKRFSTGWHFLRICARIAPKIYFVS